MSTIASVLADVRQAIELLAAADDAAATRVAASLDCWLRGESWDQALGLVPGWRSNLQGHTRNAALQALIRLHPASSDNALAGLILEGLQRVALCAPPERPDGADGYLADLLRAGGSRLCRRQWRRLIAKARLDISVLECPSPSP